MFKLFVVLYSILFSFLANCHIYICENVLYTSIIIAVFVLLNFLSGTLVVMIKSKRLRVLSHGTTMLISFCVSVVFSVVFHLLILFKVIDCDKTVLIHSIIYCVVFNFIMFWNGILCVYLTSYQLGLKTRIFGLIFGMIPIVNLIFLGIIINTTYKEVVFESKKERVNAKRRKQELCRTKYPILLVHGVFFRDFEHLNYWGRIPAELQKNGAVCFYGNHQSALSIEESARELADRIKEIVKQTGCEKLNIIAHSKGGLDCRYAIENCDVSQYVASLTTINTPHRGCAFAEWLLDKAPKKMKASISSSYNKAAKMLGDPNPDFMSAVSNLTAKHCKELNMQTSMPENIYCQSVGSVMNKSRSGQFPLNMTHNFVKLFDGKNDGLVGVDSFEWGSKYTLLDLKLKRGISHADMIDLNRENIEGFDVREFYVKLVNELKEMGL